MGKNKIALKLSLNFCLALLIFALVIGGIFLCFFKNYSIDIHKDNLLSYAQSLSSILSGEEGLKTGKGMGMGGYGAYFRFIVDIANIDVWIIDNDKKIISVGERRGTVSEQHDFPKLPKDMGGLVENVLRGKTVFGEGSSETLSQPTLTVGVPIIYGGNEIKGAVLLHSPVENTRSVIKKVFSILTGSIILALIITLILSILLSYLFTKPLNRIKETALNLSQGNYFAKCKVAQNDEIGELANTIDELAIRLGEVDIEREKLERVRRDFIANISHELRTPITVIKGSLEALHEKIVTTPQMVEEYYIQMLNETRFLENLVGDLLDLSKLQNIDLEIKISPINTSYLISDVLRSAKQLASKKNVNINMDISDTSLSILGDYGRLRQMFLILIDNAIKFSQENGKVEIRVSEDGISIKDDGPGINETDLPYIFERFYKTSKKDDKSGTGLGLSIAKQIANRHGFLLTGENNDHGGAKFTVNINPNTSKSML